MKNLADHLNSTFSYTDNLMTYADFYLCLAAVAAIFTLAYVVTKTTFKS